MKKFIDRYKCKTKKLINNPPIFFRDYFNKRYPLTHTELGVDEATESAFIAYSGVNNVLNAKDTPVDVVFTWVDNTDPAWQARYHQHKALVDESIVGQFATDIARFDNHNELYYAVKAVKRHLAWVRHIYIVTDNQTPAWIDEFEQVTVIDHRQIIDEKYLPTFNSHVIEAFLHKIPNLSENFIYFNDDVFVAKDLPKEHFFSANGLASIFISSKVLSEMQARGVRTPTLLATNKSLNLLAKQYPHTITNALVHTYYPLKKSVYEYAWQLYGEQIKAFLPNRFRSNNDLNMATCLVPWLAYYQRLATERLDVCYYFNIRSRKALTCYDKLLRLKKLDASPHSFCANDFNTELKNPVIDYRERLLKMLDAYYA
ncbi:Capsular polysaccharide phosphotransferase SacB [Moraxella lacunata]|uniref:Capsular polysaccharide phosphotransferase SacB n=1 Tax=Moraxella lacunata TaxID=477 RepID=A0A1V4GPU8_MORLA|nr:Stealth CR1 domain-containing protein [Moraxella lacunata]MDO5050588.1 Stealth CR1 domain-containing protein [Moraxella equi]OPH34653.1 capsule biosynthesis protein CapC [Moraxella lacunata]STZ00945.1 Capsular polysaccharide phosphotransferase SacB [Moraxella lacunata]